MASSSTNRERSRLPLIGGPWAGVALSTLLLVLVLVGVAFGTSALLYPLLLAAGIALGVGALHLVRPASANDGRPR